MRAGEQLRSERWNAGLWFGGAGILLYRTLALLAGGAALVLKPWVVALTLVEMALDAVTMVGSLRWWVSRSTRHSHLPLRAGAVSTLLHAARVLVFVLGRTGPCFDFDVRPEQRAGHEERWTWAQVVVASVLSAMGVIGVLAIWRARKRSRSSPLHDDGSDLPTPSQE